ncbi:MULTISPECIES: ABC transporter ATP-binding protein [Dickeya]|uniref:Teichoic acid export ATP-binding protein TagH n=1 Tax=Dickeya aquatica TaxID=1401087 RepID=A0A375A791_9GAMM|nr:MULTISPECIES: ABC transporter ATP-binding protein [Dickeya]SLM61831.1 Teichoic acid export ATP-binding protein TagH [Dickeya aquatica]
MSSDIAIKVENLNKCYEIYDRPLDRLKQFIFPPMIRYLTGKDKKYHKDFWALRDISFEIKKGETIGLIGRNGCGKSTLLQLICGTLSQTSGSVKTNGRIAALLELGSGFNPEFSGRENVYMNASVLGLKKTEIEQRFDDIVAFADIGEFIDQPVKNYSSGMVVRLAFAVIAHVDADILIIDEALAVGDAFFIQKCMRFLRSFMEKGTVLFVSHDTAAVINLCNKAIYIDKGEIVSIGSPKEITAKYLASLYEEEQDINYSADELSDEKEITESDYRDFRESIVNSSTLRNDIEIFKFSYEADSFGSGGAKINSVRLLDSDGVPLSWIVGGENVILEVRCIAKEHIFQPIIGFDFKDRLGQVIFGDNTYIKYRHIPSEIKAGQTVVAKFHFRLPMLPTGDYTINAAIADGTQEKHVQLHWVYDAMMVKVHASSICFGLVGIPMRDIELSVK